MTYSTLFNSRGWYFIGLSHSKTINQSLHAIRDNTEEIQVFMANIGVLNTESINSGAEMYNDSSGLDVNEHFVPQGINQQQKYLFPTVITHNSTFTNFLKYHYSSPTGNFNTNDISSYSNLDLQILSGENTGYFQGQDWVKIDKSLYHRQLANYDHSLNHLGIGAWIFIEKDRRTNENLELKLQYHTFSDLDDNETFKEAIEHIVKKDIPDYIPNISVNHLSDQQQLQVIVNDIDTDLVRYDVLNEEIIYTLTLNMNKDFDDIENVPMQSLRMNSANNNHIFYYQLRSGELEPEPEPEPEQEPEPVQLSLALGITTTITNGQAGNPRYTLTGTELSRYVGRLFANVNTGFGPANTYWTEISVFTDKYIVTQMKQSGPTILSQTDLSYNGGSVNDHLGVKYVQSGIYDPGFGGSDPNGSGKVMNDSDTGGNVVLFLKDNLFSSIATPPGSSGLRNGPGIGEIFLVPDFTNIPTDSAFFKYTPPGTFGSSVYGAPLWVPSASTTATICHSTTATSVTQFRDDLYQIPTSDPSSFNGNNVFFYIFS